MNFFKWLDIFTEPTVKFTSIPPEHAAEFDKYKIEESIDFEGHSEFTILKEGEFTLLQSYSTIESARSVIVSLVKQDTKRKVLHNPY